MNKRLLGLIIAIIIIIVAIIAVYSFTISEEPVQNNQTTPSDENIIENETNNETNQTVNSNIVIIQDNAFNPQNLTVKTGTTVQWINQDNNQHQITSDSRTFQSPILDNGGSYNFYFAQPGVYGYHCGIHPTEIGVITVRD